MIFYLKSKDYLLNQYNDLSSELDYYSESQNARLEIILKSLMNVSPSILSNDVEKAEDSVDFLEVIKELTDSIKKNISSITKSKNLLKKINVDSISNSTKLDDETIMQIEKFNKIAKSLEEDYNKISLDYERFVLKYIKEFTFMAKPSVAIPEIKKPIENKVVEEIEDKQIDYNNSDGLIEEKAEEVIEDDSEYYTKNEDKKIDVPESENTVDNDSDTNKTSEDQASDDSKTEDNSYAELKDNKVLLISEKQKKVFLPYCISELNDILDRNRDYSDIHQLIESEYVLPLSRYSNPILSRFREGYNLMRQRQNASITESLNLAFELAFNTLLNPAVITACRDLDELDIYLDCLNSNELDEFKLFEIKYESVPQKV